MRSRSRALRAPCRCQSHRASTWLKKTSSYRSATPTQVLRERAGATRAHLANMVKGVTRGYDRKLELVGVGFRAAVTGKALNLTLGFSHPVSYSIPEGISIE